MPETPIEWLKGQILSLKWVDDIKGTETSAHAAAIVKALRTSYRLSWAKEEFYKDIIPELRADLSKLFD